jgi:predicted DsbA family dithiol-disulfide isomerase
MAVSWTAFPLHPDTPAEGALLEKLYAGREMEIKQRAAQFRKVAEEEGLPFGERTRTYNTRLAQELGKWAEWKGKGDAFHIAVFRAYFAESKNIGQIPVLKDIAISVNLSGGEAQDIMEKRTFKEWVDRDWARSLALGVRGVPAFLMNRRSLTGAYPYDVLEKFVRDGGATER